MKKNTARKSFDQLSDSEKEVIFARMERIGPGNSRPLTPTDKRRHQKAGLRVGRPRIGEGSERINISMERGLLRTADAFARKKQITRARLIAESVRAYLAGAA